MGITDLNETYIFKISIKMRFFDVTIGIKIPFFRILVTIEPGHSLLKFVTMKCFITILCLIREFSFYLFGEYFLTGLSEFVNLLRVYWTLLEVLIQNCHSSSNCTWK